MAYSTLGNFLGIEPREEMITLTNELPMDVEIRSVGGYFDLPVKKSAKVKSSFFGEDMEVWYLGHRILFGLVPQSSNIRIGIIKSSTIGRTVFSTHADFDHLRFHNLLPMPVSIYYRGNKIGIVGGYDGKGYFSGSRSVLDLNNETFGFYLGEFIEFRLCGLDPKNPSKETKWKSVELIDSHMTEIVIGGISGEFIPPPPDTYAYRFDTPQMGFVGQTFYSNIGRKDPYNTYRTNPNAPF